MHTVQTGITQFLGEGQGLWGPLTAASVLVCAPAVLAYLIWQRQIIETFAATAGK
jgi:ABC-type glycerol-3-phosphate transport system permease component